MRRSVCAERAAVGAMRVYRKVLHLYPEDFRICYGAGMERMFHEQVEEAKNWHPCRSLALLLVREVLGVVRTAAAQRFDVRQERRRTGRTLNTRLVRVIGAACAEVHYALRSFVRRPGFAFTVVIQLGLGIGAVTTILSAVDIVLLRELPYPRAGDLVVFSNPGHSYALYSDWRDRIKSLSAVAAVWNPGHAIASTGDGVPENVSGARVTKDFFEVFGTTALHGRLFIDSDYGDSRSAVAVVSHALWQRRWGASWRNDLTITLDGNPTTVVGVVDRAFQVPVELAGGDVDVWLPLALETRIAQSRTWNGLRVVARRKPDVSLEAAQDDLNALAQVLAAEHPVTDRLDDGSPRFYRLIPLLDAIVGDARRPLYLLLGAVAMMLLVACANVTNLQLARELGRTSELALRAALGSCRARILTQLLSETMLLVLASGAAGTLLAFIGVRAFAAFNPGGFPRLHHIAIDPRVLLLSFTITCTCALLVTVPCAVAFFRSSIGVVIKAREPVVTEAQRGLSFRKTLVVVELATGLMLSVGAGLLIQSFLRLRDVDGGFATENVVAMPLHLGDTYTEGERLQFTHDLLIRIAAIPGVELAAAGATLPPYRQGRCCWFGDARGEAADARPAFTIIHPVTPEYFRVLSAKILRGRGLTDADNRQGLGNAVINETLAGMLFGRSNPLGKGILVAGNRWRVVGVVNDIRHWGPHLETGANVYVSHARYGGPFVSLQIAVKSPLDPGRLAPAMRTAVWEIDAGLPVPDITPLNRNLALTVAQPRFLSIFMAAFALLAVALAAGGIYGFFTFTMRQRHREFGVRIALGAGGPMLVGMVLRNVLLLALLGTVLGLAGAYALSRLLRSVLFGVSPNDPVAFAAAAAVLLFTALVAAYVPAYRASKTDPVETLRVE